MSIWATLKVTRMIVATTRCTRRRHRRRTPPAPAKGLDAVRAGHASCQSGLRRQNAAQWRDTHQSVCVQARGFRGPLSESGSDTGCEAESAPPSSPSLFSTTHSLCLCVVCGIVSHCSREEHPAREHFYGVHFVRTLIFGLRWCLFLRFQVEHITTHRATHI